jgi:hypothetical protein
MVFYSAMNPLYLTKVRLLAEDAIWLLTLLFSVRIYPGRLMFGWVDSRGQRRFEVAPRMV